MSRQIIYGYAYRWMKPEVYLDPPEPHYVNGTDVIARQLLGGYRDIDTQPWALQVGARRGSSRACPGGRSTRWRRRGVLGIAHG